MLRFLVPTFLTLVLALPALAKPADVYPVPCNDLWAAVKDTLGNQGNYSVISINDLVLRASFTVVGNLTSYKDTVVLTAKESGCAMNATILDVGSDDPDWRQFHHRLAKSLVKLQAVKPKAAEAGAGAGQP